MRILNCLYLLYINEDFFPSKDYIDIFYECYLNIYKIKLKKGAIKNILINTKYKKPANSITVLIDINIINIIDE
jgi:hypothetical protein